MIRDNVKVEEVNLGEGWNGDYNPDDQRRREKQLEELMIKVIELQGRPFEYGLKQSEEIKSTQLANQIRLLEVLSTNSNTKKAKEVLKDISPNLLEELNGLAEGLDIELDTVY